MNYGFDEAAQKKISAWVTSESTKLDYAIESLYSLTQDFEAAPENIRQIWSELNEFEKAGVINHIVFRLINKEETI